MDYIVALSTIVLLILLSASYFDIRYREIPDIHWWAIGVVGIIFMIISNELSPIHWMMIAGSVMILLEIMTEIRKTAFISIVYFATMGILFIYPIATSFDDTLVMQFTIIPICFILFYIMYLTGILKGGADAKCMIVMSLAFQTYPHIFDTLIPVSKDFELIFAYPIILLLYATIFSLLALIWVIMKKIRNGDRIEYMSLTLLRMPIEKAKRSHVWPKEDVINNTVMRVNETDAGAYERLESVGKKDVLVSVIIPFIVPITIAYIFLLTIGNLLFIPFV